MKILNNYVLVKPDATNKLVLATGHELYFDTRFEEQKSAPQAGTVILIPEKLTFTQKQGSPGGEFDVDMELQIGDKIVFSYHAIPTAKGAGRMIGEDYLIRYDEIVLAIRDKEVICVNGSVIVKPDYEKINTILHLPESVKNKNTKVTGTVMFASATPHRAERGKPDLNTLAAPMLLSEDGFSELNRYASPGDHVHFHFTNAIPLQHYHELFGKVSKDLLYRMKHTDIEFVDQTLLQHA